MNKYLVGDLLWLHAVIIYCLRTRALFIFPPLRPVADRNITSALVYNFYNNSDTRIYYNDASADRICIPYAR